MLAKRRIVLAIAFVTACLLINQNCTKALETRKSQGSQAVVPQSQGGDGYDGKLFINRLIGSLCPDGSDVQNSVEVKSYTSAVVTRENCAPVNKVIDQTEFSFMPHNLGNLIYTKKAFDLSPRISKDPRTSAYLCRGDETAEYYRIFHGIHLPADWYDRHADVVFKPDGAGRFTARMQFGQYERDSRVNMVGKYDSGEFPANIDAGGPIVLSGVDPSGMNISMLLGSNGDGTYFGKLVYVRPASAPPRGPGDPPDYNLNVTCYTQ